jgi:branched-subunit amino acid aminotransferase/4-amino-4-deoxychorismate lyase
VLIVDVIRIEVNGAAATADLLAYPALMNYGHFTVMQVRGGATRGLGLHLTRLDAATRELFGTGLDGDLVLAYIRHALGTATLDASVRVSVFQPDPGQPPSIMVVVRPPAEMPASRQRLTAVSYLRPVPHIKHAGTFGQIYHGQAAERAGFDDALLTGPDGLIAEGAITNIGFFDGQAVIWPDAPTLPGITMQLVTAALAERGVRSRLEPVRVADLPGFRATFVTNSLGVAPVAQVDDLTLPADPDFTRDLTEAYESVPWQPI